MVVALVVVVVWKENEHGSRITQPPAKHGKKALADKQTSTTASSTVAHGIVGEERIK